MRPDRILAQTVTSFAILGIAATPVGATTFIRAGIEKLTAESEIVVHARVTGFDSYWNSNHTFILTDVRLQPIRSMKGEPGGQDLVITLMGGTVGDLTTLIVGGPDLAPGAEYVLFLGRCDLPGGLGSLSVRDLAQGTFTVVEGPGGRRAVSQAIGHPMLPDASGISEPAGGAEGFALEELNVRIRRLTGDR
jgi:hypothetical protein